MRKWLPVIILAAAQFVMVLDSTVMNVSISTVVADLHTTVSSLQLAITFYTLTMAAFMLIGGKLGDLYGRLRMFKIGAVIYGIGSLITAFSPNIGTLIIGWSVIEGLGAVLVIPAIAALIASNYKGKDRVVAYASIGGIAGVAAAAGPLIGGFMTTYLSWRYVFAAETAVMIVILVVCGRLLADSKQTSKDHIDIPSAALSAIGLILLVFGILQSKTWGWITPHVKPVINGVAIAPLGISLVAYLIVIGAITLRLFYTRQQKLEKAGLNPLLKASLFSIDQLRSGLGVLAGQYVIIAAVFFVLPVYLQMTLGYDALKTGVKILPLSIGVIVFSVLGSRLVTRYSPRRIVRTGQATLVLGALVTLAGITADLKSGFFAAGMLILGAGLGLLASQLGNVNMSAVSEGETGEVGGLQGVSQNLGSSIGTALIGSVLIASLSTTFIHSVDASSLPSNIKNGISHISTSQGIPVVSGPQVTAYAQSQGLSPSEATEVTQLYSQSQLNALREAMFAIMIIGLLAMPLSRRIPDRKLA